MHIYTGSDSLRLSTVHVIFITLFLLQTVFISDLEYLFTFFHCDSSLYFLIKIKYLFSRHKVSAASCHLENKLF
jgi:hypothetical protein